MTKKTRRAKACDISQAVKMAVWERDGGACVVCGHTVDIMPSCHYISRNDGGLGIETNIVTLCTYRCHYAYDHGQNKAEREYLKETIRDYLKSKYPDWDEEKLIYRKW